MRTVTPSPTDAQCRPAGGAPGSRSMTVPACIDAASVRRYPVQWL